MKGREDNVWLYIIYIYLTRRNYAIERGTPQSLDMLDVNLQGQR